MTAEYKTLFPVPLDVKEALRSGLYACGTTGVGKSDIGMYAADKLMKEGVIVVVFDPSGDWIERSSIPVYTQPDKNNWTWRGLFGTTSMIFDMSKLTVQQQQEFVEWFCKTIMQVQSELPSAQRNHYFLIFEEAQIYFPEGCMRAKRYQETVKMMSVGRNKIYQVRFMCITQFSSMIDKKAMRYMKQRYFGATDEPNDVEYVQKFFPRKNREDIGVTVGTLEAGEFIYKYGKKTKLINIEPFSTERPPTPIETPQRPIKNTVEEDRIIKEMSHKKKQQDAIKSLTSFATALMWFIAILIALAMKP